MIIGHIYLPPSCPRLVPGPTLRYYCFLHTLYITREGDVNCHSATDKHDRIVTHKKKTLLKKVSRRKKYVMEKYILFALRKTFL